MTMLNHYTPGTPIARAYLDLNRITGVSVWRVDTRDYRIAATTVDDGTEGYQGTVPFRSFRAAETAAKALAKAHDILYCGLVD